MPTHFEGTNYGSSSLAKRLSNLVNIDYHARVIEIVNQMRTYGENVADQNIVDEFEDISIISLSLLP